MPGLEGCLFPMDSSAWAVSSGLWAYIGLGPGQEFIPYFLALLAGAVTACLAILQWPFLALRRRWARSKQRHREELEQPEEDNSPTP